MTGPAVAAPLSDPCRQLAMLGDRVSAMFERVLESGVFIAGPESLALESEFAAWLGHDSGLCVSSGTAALESVLHAFGVSGGDAVAVTANLDISAVTPVIRLGAEPTWVDVAPGTTGMSVDDLEARWHDRIRAVLLVHTHGYPADAAAIAAIACERGVPLIEDITHSPGVWLDGRRAGTFGRMAIMSCAPTKPLGAIGSLGLVSSDDVDLIRRARRYASYGFKLSSLEALHSGWIGPWFDYVTVGINGLPDELQAGIVRLKLPLIDGWAERRRRIAARYDDFFAQAGPGHAAPVASPSGARPAPRSYVILARERDRLAKTLADRGIATSYNYVPALHRQQVFAGRGPISLPATDQLDATILGLPNAPENPDSATDWVCEALRETLGAS